MAATSTITPASGLTAQQVAERAAGGRSNASGLKTSRTLTQIVAANVLTPFNGLLATLWVATLATGRWQNGLFGFVIVFNSSIGVVQELRAKRTLDRLAVLNEPHAFVVRDGEISEIAVDDVVQDDLVELRPGVQVAADGTVLASNGLEIDESLLTGESDAVGKTVGSHVRSGSIVVAGSGRFQATEVGADAYATRIAAEARRFSLVDSELVRSTNRLLRWISLMMLVVGPLLLWSQFRSHDNETWQDAVTGTVAALVGMVPEGLVLLTSLAFVVAAISLTRRQTLVQELPAVEVLARVDVVCIDKTGTITYGDIAFDSLEVLPGAASDDVHEALALLAASSDANATATALRSAFDDPAWAAGPSIPFSSDRKWSAASADGHGTWILGAPEMVFAEPDDEATRTARERADLLAAEGHRVLMLASSRSQLPAEPPPQLPAALDPRAIVVMAERIREDAADTLAYFAEQGVGIRVISGDSPRTVGAIAAAVGVPGIRGASDAYDARDLPVDRAELATILEERHVFGRVTPQQKQAIVGALQSKGHVVAMTGDGVNDAIALKDADIGIAMGNGSAASRAVAQLVLLDGRLAHLPDVVAEGRRVIANIERSANLFLVKNVYSLVLALIIVVAGTAYPLAPIQLTFISALTIGIPGFFLALGPNKRRYVPGFLERVMRFSVPSGAVIGVIAYSGYVFSRSIDESAGVDGGRTVATLIVLICSLWVLLVMARPLAGWKLLLVAVVAGTAAIVVSVPALATGVFLLEPTPLLVAVGLVFGVGGCVLIEIAYRAVALLLGSPDGPADAEGS